MAKSFKLPCPSCDAQVPIKDESLIGKKVDCPKCKYRFMVTKPDDLDDDAILDDEETPKKKKSSKKASDTHADDKPAKVKSSKSKKPADDDDEDDDDKPAKKKKGGAANPTLVIGLAVGGGALVLLIMGFVVMSMMGSDTGGRSTPVASNPGTRPAPSTATPPAPVPGMPETPGGENPLGGDATPETKGPPPPAADLTNLLPNKTQAITSILFDKFLNETAPGRAIVDAGYHDDYFRERLGFKLSDVTRFIRGEDALIPWAFNVIRVREPFRKKEVQLALGLDKGQRSPIREQDYFLVKPNEIITMIESGQRQEGNQSLPRTMAYHFYDDSTLIVADLDQMEAFLDRDRKFDRLSQLAGATPPATTTQPGQPAPPPPAPVQPGQPGAPPVVADTPNWLTVEPSLKLILDRLEDAQVTPVVTLAYDLPALMRVQQFLRKGPPIPIPPITQSFAALGLNLGQLDEFRLKGQLALEFKKSDVAKAIDDLVRKQLPMALPLVSQALNVEIRMKGDDLNNGQPGQPGDPAFNPAIGEGGFPGAQQPQGPLPSNPPSVIDLVYSDRTELLDVDVAMNENYYTKIFDAVRQESARAKAIAQVSLGEPRWPLLADTARTWSNDLKAFPRGTFARELPLERSGRPYAPNQRVSWMVELLPMLGRPDVAGVVNKEKSWRDPSNYTAGGSVIPAFLNPSYPQDTWTAKPPKVDGREYGSTHFIGLAGVGLDAASYPGSDPRAGIFGYDRETKLDDIKDGKENTIYMMSVPPTYQRPWIAGGGSTVMGVPTKESAKPFVHLQGNGKRGAFVLMADGSVRFLNENVSDEVFKAMVTIAGGDNVDFQDKLDEAAPKFRPGNRPTGPIAATGR